MPSTTRLGLTTPVSSAVADVPTDMATLANQLDALILAYSSGTFSARPAASALAGKIYWATDYKRSYFSDGTNWYDVQPPVGQIIAFPNATPPDATWLACDASSVLRATYPALFGLIGTTYGSVDGTHFNVPDLRGRTIVGPDSGAGRIVTAPHTMAGAGGEETHLLSTGEIPAHTHAAADGQDLLSAYNGVNQDFSINGGGTTYATRTGLANAGGGGAHNNMQPFLVQTFMIKT